MDQMTVDEIISIFSINSDNFRLNKCFALSTCYETLSTYPSLSNTHYFVYLALVCSTHKNRRGNTNNFVWNLIWTPLNQLLIFFFLDHLHFLQIRTTTGATMQLGVGGGRTQSIILSQYTFYHPSTSDINQYYYTWFLLCNGPTH